MSDHEHLEAEHAAPEHRHLGLALAVISAAQLMVVLDASIVNVALPSIQRALHFSAADLIWVINGYTLAFGGLLLLGGRTGDLYGRRRMFMVGIGLFTVSSFAGGLAQNEAWLISARVAQGVGGAIAAPTALSLIASTFPEGAPRNRAMGVYAAMSGAGAAVGVILGGVLTDALSWRYVLFVNVPIGLLVIVAAPRVLGETSTRRGALDMPGAVTATTGMTLVVYGLIHAATTSWADRYTDLSLGIGAALLVAFVLWEGRARQPLMPLHLFRSRDRSAAYAVMLAIGTAMFAMFYFLTLYMQDILDFSPLKAGVSYLPFALMIVVGAGAASRVVGRTGPKTLLMAGTLLAGGGLLWLSRSASATGSYAADVVGPMVLVAGGLAMCFVPLTLSAVAGVRRNEQGIASALLNSGQQVGGSLGLATLGTIAVQVTKGKITDLFRTLSPAEVHRAAPYLGAEPPPRHAPIPPGVHHAIDAAYVHGYTSAFLIGAGILLVAFLLATFALKRRRATAAVSGEPTEASVPVAP